MNYDSESDPYWKDGLPSRKKQWAAAILMFFVACICLLTVFAALPGCCTFCNRGQAFAGLKSNHVVQVSTAESVYWHH